jgi:hypothetical protein
MVIPLKKFSLANVAAGWRNLRARCFTAATGPETFSKDSARIQLSSTKEGFASQATGLRENYAQ